MLSLIELFFMMLETPVEPVRPIRFVIFSSYGNDSCALIQWAHEWGLEDVAVVYSDTKWATADWVDRVNKMEIWTQSLGFRTFRTSSIGFEQLARDKKGFPTQRYQWCSWILKIEPGGRWLEENDPLKLAVCIVGVRHEEAKNPNDGRAQWPGFSPKSGNHGDRVCIAPFVEMKEAGRNALLNRAGIEVLPHRSRECKCINSNKNDLKLFNEDDITAIENIEKEVGKTMYRPHRSMGATGIREVIKWANSPRGKYEPPEEKPAVCDSMYCEQSF